MKNPLPQIACFLAMAALAKAGTSFNTADSKVPESAPSQGWYASGEFSLQLSGAYAFSGNDPYTLDRYIHADHGWGGSIDAKYFVNRYLAVGMEGYAFSATQTLHYVTIFGPFTNFTTYRDERVIGAGLVTLTLRCPIGTSRVAPFGFVGGGAITGGARHLVTEFVGSSDPAISPYQSHFTDSNTEAVGQFGGGLEVRFNRHLGLISDFSWNVVDGRDNNFGMARTGINFAF